MGDNSEARHHALRMASARSQSQTSQHTVYPLEVTVVGHLYFAAGLNPVNAHIYQLGHLQKE